MEPQKGMFLANRTSMYLLPILKTFSKDFLKAFSEVTSQLLVIATADVLYLDAKNEKIPSLFFLFDKNGPYNITEQKYFDEILYKKNFIKFLKYIRKYELYIDDYIYGDIRGDTHCLVLRVPDTFLKAYNHFHNFEYSRMYTEEDLEVIGIPKVRQGKPNKIYQVLVKDSTYIPEFEIILNQTFGTSIKLDPDDNRELDLPFDINNEWLNSTNLIQLTI